MRIIFLFLLISTYSCLSVFSQSDFNRFFEKKSLRIDFALSGNFDFQIASLQQLRQEPTWSGPIKNLIDPFEYGGYYIQVFDKESDQLIYSRGLNTLFEEWRATEQAKTETQSWTNSIAIPYPKKEVTLNIQARSKKDLQFESLLKVDVDPSSIFIDKSKLHSNSMVPILINGDVSDKIDLVFLGEGYSAEEQEKFIADVNRFTEAFFKSAPFNLHQKDFNIRAVKLISEESGTDISGKGIFKNTALNSGFYTFGVERYLTTPDMKSIRDAVWDVPCDAIFILVNTDIYGGGGMYNFYAIGSADNAKTIEVFVHEFGHSFAGLADEYFSSEVGYDEDYYDTNVEPWEPNITSLVNFKSKWENMLSPGTPIPTPLNETYKNNLGVFEGAGYLSKGMYRPVDHCMMRDLTPFCPVCKRAIVRMIDFLCDRNLVQ